MNRTRPGPPGTPGGEERSASAVEYRGDGAVLLGDPPILKLEPDTSFVVVNAGEHPLDARTRELSPEAIAAMRDWCDARLGSMRRHPPSAAEPAKGGEGGA